MPISDLGAIDIGGLQKVPGKNRHYEKPVHEFQLSIPESTDVLISFFQQLSDVPLAPAQRASMF